MRILFAAGGSIGHIAPCVAAWRAMEKLAPGAQAHFVCSTREDDVRFLSEEHLPFTPIADRNIGLVTLPLVTLRAWRLLGNVRPDVVFTKEGGVAVPMALAAWLRGIPIVAHKSDANWGRGTRLISRFARRVIDGFTTGNPLRPGITDGLREEGLRVTGLQGDRPILLVTGGSQGAQTFNDTIAAHLEQLLRCVDVVHITGRGKAAAQGNGGGYWSCPFAHRELPHLYAIASLALSRAGTGNITELAANGVPTILVPLEGVAHDHQLRNAELAASSGGCVLLRQARLADAFVDTVNDLVRRPGVLSSMSEKIRTLHKPDADVAVAKILLAISRERCGVS